MLGAGRGGLEQALLDYVEALVGEGHPVTAVCHPKWLDRPTLERLPVAIRALRSFNEWDPLAARRLRRIVLAGDASAVVTIGRRATSLARLAGSARPIVAVAQNYSLKPMIGLEHVLATTSDLKRVLIEAGQPAERITVVPNMVRVPPDAAPPAPEPAPRPVIGALGRFVRKKGFAELIDALALLQERGVEFTCRIAGDGPEAGELERRIEERGLAGRVELTGWVSDKRAFFDGLDVFCVPSLHEPFGIVVIEGFAHARATVVSDAEGPSEIVAGGVDALMVPRGDPGALAEALDRLCQQPELRARLAGAALAKARSTYDLPVVARRLSDTLGEIIRRETG
ncbi:MAG: glycosyltransferase [Geminicoccaceae bacterium]|nr:glycosyltransferase [Geminicoccaceae bacterium]